MPATSRVLKLRYAKACCSCGEKLTAGTQVWWDAPLKTATCGTCTNSGSEYHPPQPMANVRAGTSASLKVEWLTSHPKPRAATGPSQQLTIDDPSFLASAWQKGVEGEQRVGGVLDSIHRADIKVLHDRRRPGGFANIDHIVVAPSGVYVIDSKKWSGRMVLVEREEASGHNAHLYVGGHDRSGKLKASMQPQVECIQMILDGFAPIARTYVQPVLCFVDADWSSFRARPMFDGVAITSPESILPYLTQPGPLDEQHVDMIWSALATRLKPAV
jgi:hypothetical protein